MAERRVQLGRRVAERYRIPKVYQTHEELCADPSIDAVVEITSDDMHAPIASGVMNAGKHVYLEKPMATILPDARTMVDTADRNGVKLMIGYMKRYDPGIELAKSIIDKVRVSGELGNITHMRVHCFGGDWICNVGKPITTDEPYMPVKPRPPEGLSGDQIKDFYWMNNVYCHNVNLIRHLIGDIIDIKYADLSRPTKIMVFGMDGFDVTLEVGHLSSNFCL